MPRRPKEFLEKVKDILLKNPLPELPPDPCIGAEKPPPKNDEWPVRDKQTADWMNERSDRLIDEFIGRAVETAKESGYPLEKFLRNLIIRWAGRHNVSLHE